LKFAEDMLDERFLMLNGDTLTDLDLSAQIAAHVASGARATLALYPVEDPSSYGLVRLNDDSSVREFVEKPSPDQIDTNNISAGAYVLERSVLDLLVKGERASIERDVFPRLVGDGLFGKVLSGYWMDIGTPERYLEATFDILEGNVRTEVGARMGERFVCVEDGVESGGRVVPAALIESGCRIAPGARIGGRAVLEHDVTVGEGTTVENAVVMKGATIGAHCVLRGCIVAAGVTVGDHCVIDGMSVIGEGVVLGADNVVSNGARIFPGVTLPDGALRF
jgi:mannose-1-phosphate guanylyltransferase